MLFLLMVCYYFMSKRISVLMPVTVTLMSKTDSTVEEAVLLIVNLT